ncbi:huntingtin-interacting protein K-like [Hydractinia symbiolongicarpus]|uniref:huntingtin-interacting protein K-like n=1 Tax=Hydractinia symbiolongicarpus TaxID=13093 RepID=UPI00255198A8|nr:huntingtin-interacting protein K-like [Hydractinia symbiolongicarpus]
MATTTEGELVNGEIENATEEPQTKEKKHDKAACADLEKITDYEEDKEINNQDIGNAISLIEGRRSEEGKKKAAREKELSQVKVKKEDIELIVKEMEVSQSIAERKLREASGDVEQALIALTN